jgi:microcompartment protein CcmL/EutN
MTKQELEAALEVAEAEIKALNIKLAATDSPGLFEGNVDAGKVAELEVALDKSKHQAESVQAEFEASEIARGRLQAELVAVRGDLDKATSRESVQLAQLRHDLSESRKEVDGLQVELDGFKSEMGKVLARVPSEGGDGVTFASLAAQGITPPASLVDPMVGVLASPACIQWWIDNHPEHAAALYDGKRQYLTLDQLNHLFNRVG